MPLYVLAGRNVADDWSPKSIVYYSWIDREQRRQQRQAVGPLYMLDTWSAGAQLSV